MIIEKARETDVETGCAIDDIVLDNTSRRSFVLRAIAAEQCLVARMSGVPIAFAILDQSFFGQHFVSLLIVHPQYRRRGVATALIRHIESLCPTQKLFTSTNESNIAMQRLCERLGFVRSGYIENLDEGDPEIIYFRRSPATAME